MRPDVKLGITASLVVVVVAGGYFLYRDSRESPVALSEAKPVAKDHAAKGTEKGVPRAATRTETPSTPGNGKAMPDKRTGRDSDRVARRANSSNPRSPSTGVAATAQPRGTAMDPGGNAASLTKPEPSAGQAGPSSETSPVITQSTVKGTSESANAKPTVAVSGSEKGDMKPSDERTIPGTPADSVGLNREEPRSDTIAAHVALPTDEVAPVPSPVSSPSNKIVRNSQPGVGEQPVRMESHRAQPGDTLASLARDYYGDEKYAKLLVDNNRQIVDPNALMVGTLINIPEFSPIAVTTDHRLAARDLGAESAASTKTYTVQSGDSFYGIARDVLGDAARWKELLNLNHNLVGGDPKKLRVGQVISLPQT